LEFCYYEGCIDNIIAQNEVILAHEPNLGMVGLKLQNRWLRDIKSIIRTAWKANGGKTKKR
jgi:hypothetical protein